MSSHRLSVRRGILNALTNDHGGGGAQQRQKYFGIWPPFRGGTRQALLAPEKNLHYTEGKKGAIVNVMRG